MSSKRDLYEVLEVSRKASAEEIKSAYRNLSKTRHPDKPGGSEEAFKELNHAYEVLKDEKKRQIYDMTGNDEEGAGGNPFGPGGSGGPGPFGGMPFGFGGGGFGGGIDLSDLFGMFSGRGGGAGGGAGGRQVKRPKGPNKVHEIPIRLFDFYHGRTYKMNMTRQVFCADCQGEGCLNWKTCADCRGQGVKETMMQIAPGMMAVNRGPCEQCSGKGRLRGKDCEGCKSKGLVSQDKTVEVVIKAGAEPGDILKFEEMCSDMPEFEKPGDVLIRLTEAEEDLDVVRQGRNLLAKFQISLSEALLGCKRYLFNHPSYTNPEGLLVEIKAGVQSAETFRVKGKGMPGGDLLVTITVVASESEKKVLEESRPILQSLFLGAGVGSGATDTPAETVA